MRHLLLIPIVFFVLVVVESIKEKNLIGFVFWVVATIAVCMWYRQLILKAKKEEK